MQTCYSLDFFFLFFFFYIGYRVDMNQIITYQNKSKQKMLSRKKPIHVISWATLMIPSLLNVGHGLFRPKMVNREPRGNSVKASPGLDTYQKFNK